MAKKKKQQQQQRDGRGESATARCALLSVINFFNAQVPPPVYLALLRVDGARGEEREVGLQDRDAVVGGEVLLDEQVQQVLEHGRVVHVRQHAHRHRDHLAYTRARGCMHMRQPTRVRQRRERGEEQTNGKAVTPEINAERKKSE